eukprot:363564-Chlamydomonas_euryale.AAC.3
MAGVWMAAEAARATACMRAEAGTGMLACRHPWTRPTTLCPVTLRTFLTPQITQRRNHLKEIHLEETHPTS